MNLPKEKYYHIFRDYRLAEHNLINCRLTWFLTIQGFLFATYGLSIQKLAEVQARSSSNLQIGSVSHLKNVLYIIPVIGLLISFLVMLSVYAAFLSLKRLKVIWDEEVKNLEGPWLPDPAASGVGNALFYGLNAPFGIPIVLLFSWIVILICLIWSKV